MLFSEYSPKCILSLPVACDNELVDAIVVAFVVFVVLHCIRYSDRLEQMVVEKHWHELGMVAYVVVLPALLLLDDLCTMMECENHVPRNVVDFELMNLICVDQQNMSNRLADHDAMVN